MNEPTTDEMIFCAFCSRNLTGLACLHHPATSSHFCDDTCYAAHLFNPDLGRKLGESYDREALAAVIHDIWAHWMEHLFSVGHVNPLDNSVRLSTDSVFHWRKQMETPYTQLSEREKDSDRHQADKIIAVLKERNGK